MVRIGNDWDEVLRDEFSSENYLCIREFLRKEYASHTVYPHMNNIFAAFKATPYSCVRVVILGQDPYHGHGQAHGMSFSVPNGVQLPPSLVNIYKEIESDIGAKPVGGCLEGWAKQGVLLLNSVLTVRASQALSHAKCGWEQFTNNVISLINKKTTPVVFILWGNFARGKARLVTNPIHHVLESAHPSPLSSYRFFGCKHFSKTNHLLSLSNQPPINWLNI